MAEYIFQSPKINR